MPRTPSGNSIIGEANRFVFEFLKTAAGSMEMGVDGGTPVPFLYTATQPTILTRCNFSMYDDALEDVDGFFTIAATTNGLKIEVKNSAGTVLQNFGAIAVKRHADLNNLAGTDTSGAQATPATARMAVRWTFERAGAALKLDTGDQFIITVQDDISALAQFRTMVQGYLL